jgi:hypothetical protein
VQHLEFFTHYKAGIPDRVGPEALVPILRSLRLHALAQVDNLNDLKKIVLAVELAAGITRRAPSRS